MAKLTALSSDTHNGLKLKEQSGIIYAQNAHMLPLRVTEVAQATVDFPVMMSRMSNGAMSLSALTSFEPNKNLFVAGDEWNSSFQPAAMKTYPLFLMKAEDGRPEPILGVDLALNYADGQTNRIRGLSMIHEDNLQSLPSERLTELRDRGYLAPIYAMLFSVFQLNALIRRNNAAEGTTKIKNINLEVSKDNRSA